MRSGQSRTLVLVFALYGIAVCAQERALPLPSLRSGSTFASPDIRAMQDDDVANPGMLWVERGEKLWNAGAGAEDRTCASCHGDARVSMRGVSARYPAHDAATSKLFDLEARIDDCRTRRQKAGSLPRDADDLLALTAYVSHQSRGLPLAVSIDGPARAWFLRGQASYYRRQGQMNLSCAQCHDQNWGRRLLAETISQGHGNAYPAYRLEWQTLGSLQRRLRACFFWHSRRNAGRGVGGAYELELFLAWRAEGLPVEAPGVRR
jgi:sulfur-oxidizing protein SoxA